MHQKSVFAPATEQNYGKNLIAVRETDEYVSEYVRGFVDKWDELIDWEQRAECEGRCFIDVLKARDKETVLDVATGTGFHSVQLLKSGFDVSSSDGSAEMLAKAFVNGMRHEVVLKTIHADWRWLNKDVHGKFSAIWGGEDIHIGLYDTTVDIRAASRLAVDHMVGKLGDIVGKRVIDLGSGYGGAARVLADKKGAHVTCLNLSSVENGRNRKLTAEAGLSDRIDVVDGSFDAMPFPDASFDLAWSQDAILHAPDRSAVLDEVARVLKPGGLFVFHDPMQVDGLADTTVLQPIYDRIHLPDLASIGFYRDGLTARGFTEVETEVLTRQLGTHYRRVRKDLLARQNELDLSDAFVARMSAGLNHWVEGAANGNLRWAMMLYRKVG